MNRTPSAAITINATNVPNSEVWTTSSGGSCEPISPVPVTVKIPPS